MRQICSIVLEMNNFDATNSIPDEPFQSAICGFKPPVHDSIKKIFFIFFRKTLALFLAIIILLLVPSPGTALLHENAAVSLTAAFFIFSPFKAHYDTHLFSYNDSLQKDRADML